MNKKFFTFLFPILLACVGCNNNSHQFLPDELSGFWTTNDSRYQGRFIELSNAYVIVGPGDGSADVQRITDVKSVASGSDITYTIASKDTNGADTQLVLVFENVNGGQFELGNQRGMIWKRCKGEQCGVEDKMLSKDR